MNTATRQKIKQRRTETTKSRKKKIHLYVKITYLDKNREKKNMSDFGSNIDPKPPLNEENGRKKNQKRENYDQLIRNY